MSFDTWYRRHGVRVKAVHFNEDAAIDDNITVPPGTLGMIDSVDDAGIVHVAWDNGSSIGVIPDADTWLEDVADVPIKMRPYKWTPAFGVYENHSDWQSDIQTATVWTLHLHLHHKDDLDAVLERLSNVGACGLTGEYTTGDSFEAWAEKPRGDEDWALHVYFRADSPEQAAQRALHLANHAYFSHGAHLAYAVSTSGDWAEQINTTVGVQV